MAREIGKDQAKEIADAHEEHSDGPEDEKKMDLCNNKSGRDVSDKEGSCADLCSHLLDSGKLKTLDESRWRDPPGRIR